MSLDDLCVNLDIAKSQLNAEMKAYLHSKGCEGFKQQGCYTCSGYNKDCKAYLPMKDVDEVNLP